MDKDLKSLFKAASENDLKTVKKLLRRRVDLNHVDEEGNNAINLAVKNKQKEMVKYLLRKGARLYDERTKMSTLILAIKYDLKDMLLFLLSLGANINEGQYDRVEYTPLCFAICMLNMETIQLLVHKGADVNAKNPSNSRTALHEAASCITFFSDPITPENLTPLRIKIIDILLENGADVDATDKSGLTALDGALQINHKEISTYLIEKAGATVRRKLWSGAFEDCLLPATKLGDEKLIRLCLERGSDYTFAKEVLDNNQRPATPLTPYCLALLQCKPEILRVFWAFGCPLDLLGEGGSLISKAPISSVKEACKNEESRKRNNQVFAQAKLFDGIRDNDYVMIASAIAKGAEVKGTCVEFPSPLHHVATHNLNSKIARILLAKGVPVNKLDTNKKTSLSLALSTSNLNTTKELLKHGACVTKEDFEMLGCVKNEEILKLMGEVMKAFKLAKKGSMKVVKQIRELLDVGNKEMAQILMNCADGQGRSLLNLSLEKGHSKIARKLMRLRIENL